MKHTPRTILLVVAAVTAAASVCSANVAGIDVTIKKDGKAVSRARTDAAGKFATGNLEPGTYNVEFRGSNAAGLKGQQLSISVVAGKQPPRQAKASGNHLSGGVALDVQVAKPSKLTGSISEAGAAVAQITKVPAGYEKVKANVKVINGKRHVWVPGPIGSNMGGRWVEEGSEEAALSTSNRRGGDGEVLRKLQDTNSGAATLNHRNDMGTPDTGRGP